MPSEPPAPAFLAATTIVDWQDAAIQSQAAALRGEARDTVEIARRLFEWVRDEIPHTVDAGLEPVSCAASEVLRLRTGYCYAKAHLLAALLRASGIPAGFGYQRLSIDDVGPPYCLHGFNAVLLPDHGWYRLDPRGNKPGIDARFDPPREHLAFEPRLPGEHTFERIWAEPEAVVVAALQQHRTRAVLARNLPDLEPDAA